MASSAAMGGSLRRILGFLSPHKRLLLSAQLCMLVLAATTCLYAFLTGPLLTFLLTGGKQGLSTLQRFAPDLLAGLDPHRALFFLPGALVVVALVKGVAYLGQFYGMGMLGQRVVADLRRAIFEKLLGLSPTWFEKHHSGDLLSRFTADVAAIELFATYGVAAVLRDGTQLLALLATVMILDWKLSLMALGIVPLAGIPVARLAQKLRLRVRAGQASLGKLGEHVQEGLWGVRIIQAYGLRDRELVRFDREIDRYFHETSSAIRARALTPALLETLIVAALAGTLAFAAQAVVGHTMSADRLVSFVTAMGLLYQPAKELGRVSPWLLQATAGAERVLAILEAKDPLGAQPAQQPLPKMQKSLELRGVHFAYGDAKVLRGLDLELKQGEVVGLIGESGGGKSTVVKLVLRFLDPQQGGVTVDGVDLRRVSVSDARSQSALVTQEPLLFADSIRANIAYGNPPATDAQVEEAAKAAFADTFIRQLPEGYATRVGERGVRLSGGQKQRIALARALLAAAPILVLDEATSALDAESEREVQEALDHVLRGKTALIIAHRLSAVRGATRICVLKEGRIVEQGTHEALLAKDGEYARIARLQGQAAATPPRPSPSGEGGDMTRPAP